jgi:hypothetical protein
VEECEDRPAAQVAAATDPSRDSIEIVVHHGTMPRGGGLDPNVYMATLMLWLLEIEGRWIVVGKGEPIT